MLSEERPDPSDHPWHVPVPQHHQTPFGNHIDPVVVDRYDPRMPLTDHGTDDPDRPGLQIHNRTDRLMIHVFKKSERQNGLVLRLELPDGRMYNRPVQHTRGARQTRGSR